MPRALAIETSGRIGSVALVENGHSVVEDQFPHGLRHAAEIVNRIDALCRNLNWRPADLAELYVSIGPGSFTGLRIGVTLAKTLAFATGARLVAVPSVEVLARNAPPGWQNLVIVLDAKRDQIFTARFANAGGEPVEVEPAHLDSLAAMLDRSPRPVHLIGDGIPFHERFIDSSSLLPSAGTSAEGSAGTSSDANKDPRPDPPPEYGEREQENQSAGASVTSLSSVIITPPELWRARAAAVAEIGIQMAVQGRFVSPDSLTPLYVRRPEAEEKLEERN